MTAVIGIDPGLEGAIALFIDNRLQTVEDMPVTETHGKSKFKLDAKGEPTRTRKVHREIDGDALRDKLIGWHALYGLSHAFIEKVGSMPGQGHVGTFNFGNGYGLVQGLVISLFLPRTFVQPAVWKASMGCTSEKDTSRRRAKQLFPHLSALFDRVKDADRAEAALIGAFGLTQCLGANG